ncbi:MAG: hypothetical protein JETCAE03_32190 [Ignavibacteriaceae bacterium]|jgi:hypothetical protein|nr:MAG: hypothetical protein JETCAE03_32190 [Ignavibacteriaceae bacterium]
MNFSEKDLDQYIKKLKIEDGDTLFVDPGFVNIDEEVKLREFIQRLAKWYEEHLKNVVIIIAKPGTDITQISEKEMNEAGWYRK